MPRSRRRPGVTNGKTRQQEIHAAQNRAKRDKARRMAEAARRRVENEQDRAARIRELADDKYANYPGNRPMPHPGAPR